MESIGIRYAHMDFPMLWHLEELRLDGAVALAEAVAKRKSLERGTNMQWRLFATDLVICFEEFKSGNHVRALAALARCDEDIEGMQATGNPLFAYSPEALQHVVLASRGFVLSDMPGLQPKGSSLLDDCLAKFKDRIRVSTFQSALIGIRSQVFMAYGLPGTRKAKEYVGEALKIDSTVAEWHFLYGKCMGRLRRIFTYTDIPSENELKHHQLAVSLSEGKKAYYLVYLAQCQREMAFRMGRCTEENVPLTEKAKSLFDESVVNYVKAEKIAEKCCHVLARCALGFLKLPKDPYGNVGKAEEIMRKILDMCPDNPMYHHIWALINERGLRDTKTALTFFENTARKNVFVGWIDLVRLTYLQHKDAYNPTADLVHMLTLFPEEHLKDRILIQLGSFHIFQRNHLFKALEYVMEVFNRDTASQNLTVHYNIFMGLGHPINLLPVIFDECRIKCAHSKTNYNLKKKCREVVVLWSLIYPDLAKSKPKDHRKEILQESFLYTHPWARSRGRDRRRKDIEKNSKCKSSVRSKSKGTKTEPEFKPFFPDPSTILKGWLTEEEQRAKYESRIKWKSSKNRTKEENSPRGSSTRTQSLDSGTGRVGARGQAGSNWRRDLVSRDSSTEAASRRRSPAFGLSTFTRRPSFSTSNDDSADPPTRRRASWRHPRSVAASTGVESSQTHRDPSCTTPHKDSSATKPDWDSRSSSQETTWRSKSRSRDASADLDRPFKAEYSRSLSRSSATRTPPTNWRTEQAAIDKDSSQTPIDPESRLFTQDQRSKRASWSSIPSASESVAANAEWPALGSAHPESRLFTQDQRSKRASWSSIPSASESVSANAEWPALGSAHSRGPVQRSATFHGSARSGAPVQRSATSYGSNWRSESLEPSSNHGSNSEPSLSPLTLGPDPPRANSNDRAGK